MGARENMLRGLLQRAGLSLSSGMLRSPKYEDVRNSRYADEVQRVYLSLGGVKEEFPARLGGWDLVVGRVAGVGDIAVELDELLHFNRYRAKTLSSSVYSELPHFAKMEYLHYCADYEGECLRAGSYGGKWSNPSCESQFGPASPQGDLSGNGAPRWKQRAFYDFLKDISLIVIGVPVVRIAIWDTIDVDGETKLIADVLDQGLPTRTKGLIELVGLLKRRVATV